MPSRQLSKQELDTLFAPLLSGVRERLLALSDGDDELLWALRRKLAKELTYDERGKPMDRRKLKLQKRNQQGGLCALCKGSLPEKYAVFDRLEAMGGYIAENTRLLCVSCDTRVQHERGYR